MSVPQRDVLFHILYNNDTKTTMKLCQESAQRLAKTLQDPLPFKLLEIAGKNEHMARCVLILLLNVDMGLKEIVTKPYTIDEAGITLQPLCGYKAPMFFKTIDSTVIPNFLRDELKTTITFEQEIQETYQCS